jgi:hypothetical protein
VKSRIGIALFIVAVAGLGWMLKEQFDTNRDQRTKLADNRSQERPAEEVFRLRSACGDLGQRLLKENDVNPNLTFSQRSHYNQRTNRCYVELTMQTSDKVRSVYRFLYDGQTNDQLAHTRVGNDGKKFGMMAPGNQLDHKTQDQILERSAFDVDVAHQDRFWAEANAYIELMMLDDGR